jgi:vancomycin aglycone glucosyltransferase
MRLLLATIGSRGEVQPVVGLAVRLLALGQEVRVCAPPDFRDLVEGHAIAFTPVGPELSATGKASPTAAPPTPEQARQMVEATVAAQFDAVTAAAEGCDVILAAGYILVAGRSVAEQMGIRYVWAGYSPNALPSQHLAPPVFPMLGANANSEPWAQDAARYNMFREPLNAQRASAGLAPVDDVRSHMFTGKPWLAADPTLAPWPGDDDVVQTGAWLVPDDRPLSPELEDFLDAGEPPVYFGFGSIRAPQDDLGEVMIQSARALGRRAVLLRGWAGLSPVDSGPDCLSIGEVNQQVLFKRVAAVVHHGGAGTTTAAVGAGAPQVIVPQIFDQPYFAQRVQDLGIGAAHAPGTLTVDSLTEALSHALQPDVAVNAKSVAEAVRTDGADVAANLLIAG